LLLTACLACSSSSLFSEIEEGDWELEKVDDPSNDKGPFAFSGNFDATGKSKFDSDHHKDEKVSFMLGNATGAFIFYYDKRYCEGALVSVGYTYANLDWKDNPFFDTKNYNSLNLSLGGFTYRLKDWFWKTLLTANIDTNEWDTDYTNYDITFWGRYNYCESIGLHIGFIIQTGMKMDRVYPIIGFDWKISQNWKLNLIFPVDMSLAYYITKAFTVGVAVRPFDYRNRATEHNPIPMAVFRYQSLGAEFAVNYDNDSWITANLHVGEILGGHLRVATRHNEKPKRLKFKSAPYAGGALVIKF